MNDKTVTMSRELAQFALNSVEYLALRADDIGYSNEPVATELRALLAAPVVERRPVVIDLDAVDWEAIQKAADESNWMPNEYMRNDWISDVCNFLKYGRAEHPAPPELAELQAAIKDLKAGWYTDDCDNLKFWPEEVEELQATIVDLSGLLIRANAFVPQIDPLRSLINASLMERLIRTFP